MLLSFLAFILIVMIAAYYATQGLFSATISLIAAIFGSVLAMGLFEALQGPIASFKPAYGRGTTFLLIFFLALSGCRLAADYLVPQNIRLSKAIDRTGGAISGFFAAMVIVGSIVIGVEMLPLPTTLLGSSWLPAAMGFDRYPAESGMQGDRPGMAAAPGSVIRVLQPDRFTLLVWDGASGRGLGGERPFASIHPDLTVESYGYRNTVQYGSSAALPADLLTVGTATEGRDKGEVYCTEDQAFLKRCSIPETDKRTAVVRIYVKPGEEPPHSSADPLGTGNFFRITASEIRMVTDQGRQYYPIGHLENGTKFQATPLGSGHLVDDYVGGKVIEDWVFQIERDESPKWLEVKELARKELVVQDKPLPALAASAYPVRGYRKDASTLAVTVQGNSGALTGARVFLMSPNTKLGVVQGALDTASKQLITINDQIARSEEPWMTAAGKPGIPNTGQLKTAQTVARDNLGLAMRDVDPPVPWDVVLQAMVIGNCKPNGEENVANLPGYFKSTIEPLLNQNRADMRGNEATDGSGKAELKNVALGTYTIICSSGTGDSFYLWTLSVKLPAKTTVNEILAPGKAVFSLKK